MRPQKRKRLRKRKLLPPWSPRPRRLPLSRSPLRKRKLPRNFPPPKTLRLRHLRPSRLYILTTQTATADKPPKKHKQK